MGCILSFSLRRHSWLEGTLTASSMAVTGCKDRRSLKLMQPKADAAITHNAVRDFGLVDVIEMLDTFSPQFTRWRGTPQARLSRDYVSGELSREVATYDTKGVPISDHGFVSTVMKFSGMKGEQARHNAPWKMNTNLLDSQEFIEETQRAFQNLAEGGADAVS